MKVEDLYDIAKGKKPDGLTLSALDGDMRFIQIGDLRDDTNLKYCQPSNNQVTCEEDDLLIAWDGAHAGIISYGLIGAFGSTLARLRPITDKLITPFVGRYLQSQLAEIQRNRTGATIPHVNGKHLRNLHIPVPPLADQKRIADILDMADALRKNRREALSQLDILLQSTFQDMFGDPVTNPMGWEVVEIGDLLTSANYGTSKKADLQEGEFPILRMNNITYSGEWDFSSLKYIDLAAKDQAKHLVHKGQIIFNRTNSKALVGKTAVYRRDEPFAYAGYLVRGIVNELADPEYIGGFMNTPQIKQFLKNKCRSIVGMANINAKEFQAIRIPKPPLELQQRFARIVESVEQQKVRMREHHKELDTLFASLQSRAFKGEL